MVASLIVLFSVLSALSVFCTRLPASVTGICPSAVSRAWCASHRLQSRSRRAPRSPRGLHAREGLAVSVGRGGCACIGIGPFALPAQVLGSQREAFVLQPGGRKPGLRGLPERGDLGEVLGGPGPTKRQGQRPELEVKQALALAALEVILALGRGEGEQRDLSVIEAVAPVRLRHALFHGPGIGQEEARRARLGDRGGNRTLLHVR